MLSKKAAATTTAGGEKSKKKKRDRSEEGSGEAPTRSLTAGWPAGNVDDSTSINMMYHFFSELVNFMSMHFMSLSVN